MPQKILGASFLLSRLEWPASYGYITFSNLGTNQHDSAKDGKSSGEIFGVTGMIVGVKLKRMQDSVGANVARCQYTAVVDVFKGFAQVRALVFQQLEIELFSAATFRRRFISHILHFWIDDASRIRSAGDSRSELLPPC